MVSETSPDLSALTETVGRRTFLKVLGGAGPAAAVAACSPVPTETIIPYVVPPDDVVPGVATWYASVCGECPNGCGTRVRTREGRAVKIEGNPAHPGNQGALCTRGQAALQGLYNPDRFRGPQRRRTTNAAAGQSVFEPLGWEEAETELAERIRALVEAGNADRIAVVTPLLSGTLDALVDRWAAAVGGARRLRYEAFAYEPLRAANRILFDRPAVPSHDFGGADLIVSFGADFLETWLSTVSQSRAFADARRPENGGTVRAVHFEPRLSLTASSADEWIRIEPGAEGVVAAAMVRTIVEEGRVQAAGITGDDLARIRALVADSTPEAAAARSGVSAGRIVQLARAFSDPGAGPGRTLAAGGGVAVSGPDATATQVAIGLLNYVAGNVGETVRFAQDGLWDNASTCADLLDLAGAMRDGSIEVLVLHQVNPVHTLPAAADFAGALDAVPFVAATSSWPDETTARADLILPSHTPLESWGDHRPAAGQYGLMQPAMRPVYDTRHLGDILLGTGRAALAGAAEAGAGTPDDAPALPEGEFYDVLRDEWRAIKAALDPPEEPANDPEPADETQPQDPAAARRAAAAARQAAEAEFEGFWADVVRQGGRWSPVEPQPVALGAGLGEMDFAGLGAPGDERRALTLVAYPSLHFLDGRGANRPWLQEIPDPLLKTAWGCGAEMTPETAAAVGAQDGQLVTLESDHGTVDATVVLNPHLHPGIVAIPIGQGHSDFGRYATGRGVNPAVLLDPAPEAASGGPRWAGTRVDATARELHRPLARLQQTFDQQGRGIAQAVSRAALEAGDVHPEEEHFSLYPEHEHPTHRWGMAIDLNACNGCNACVAACYAENNVPVLGADRMVRGRTMSWLRIERFVEEQPAPDGGGRVDSRFLPMLCQHCDHAPCESVCPVYATYHSEEGLNAQIYNRCVGTRYCSNNCPYKVRRFNWWEPEFPEPMNLQLNPDVTVRSAGVMEKCTFCVQRIQEGKDHARDEDRPVRDGDVTPACAQTCPAQAIVFGDLNDPQSRVSQLSAADRGYHALGVLNTRPAVTYLKKVTT
ncbi:MAG: 4Fe-4S dicluster domain-containing protein [Acidobacteria bacterium]|nr:4Fe-4S dicluster domain-containing protein [Acidobacteriota bacterium]